MTEEPRPQVPQSPPARARAGHSRGYWISPAPTGVTPAGTPPAGADTAGTHVADAPAGARASDDSQTTGTAQAGTRPGRVRTSRKRRRLRLAVLLLVLAGIATTVALVVTGRTVVPVVSDNLFPIYYQGDIARVAEQYDLDPYLVAAVVKTESGFDPEAVSPVGAVGLMQLMPATAEWITSLDMWQGDSDPGLTDPADNLELGACYLAYLSARFGEDNREATLAAYNAGPGAVGEWVEAAGGQDSFGLDDIRFPETRTFVERVERYRFLYSRVHPDIFAGAGAAAGAHTGAVAGGDAFAGTESVVAVGGAATRGDAA